jgi:FAD/FMN-containing dehydrogenase
VTGHGPRWGSHRVDEKSVRTLVRAGCGEEELRLLLSYFGAAAPDAETWTERLDDLAKFATDLGPRAARDYFRAIAETKAVRELTDPRLLAFARSVDPHTAEWYFWAIWGTNAVPELTQERVLTAVEFFRAIDSPATVEYFLAIRETRAAALLTGERVLEFAKSLGSEAATEYFGAFWETRAVTELTQERLFAFARAVGPEAAKEFFLALRETKAVDDLLRPEFLEFASTIARSYATELFRAIRETRAAAVLTSEPVRLYAELLGRPTARIYFRVLASTRAVEALTRPGLLRSSAVVRSISPEAALDYFTAAIANPPEHVPEATAGTEPIPVLTLLDLPTYGRYRAAAMAAVSGVFWAFAGPWAAARASPIGLVLVAVVWAGLLSATYAFSGVAAARSGELFLARRRQLLNEHGIRWHDCRGTVGNCPVCWTSKRTHEDGRFDIEPFCRCPAC